MHAHAPRHTCACCTYPWWRIGARAHQRTEACYTPASTRWKQQQKKKEEENTKQYTAFVVHSRFTLRHTRLNHVPQTATCCACRTPMLTDRYRMCGVGIIPSHTIPYHTILYHTITYHTIPYHTIPYHTIPYHTIPYHTMPYHTIPYHTIPYHTIPYQGTTVLTRRGLPGHQ